MQISVIITAGGIGKRMGGPIPKQFVVIAGAPLLFHTISKFHSYDATAEIVVTLPESWVEYWKELLITYDFQIRHQIVSGGEERFHSIKNALEHCKGTHIFVHDGVRPLVSDETLDRCIEALKKSKAVVPVIPVKESLRKIAGEGTVAVPRALYRVVQTPQCFDRNVLQLAYQQEFHVGITDDASLVEEMGVDVVCVEGNEENIKITTKTDLILAEAVLK